MPQPARTGSAHEFRRYTVSSVEKVDPPHGSTGKWHRYVLDNGSATITGVHCGSVKEVTDYATQYAEQINSRRQNGQSIWAPRGRKPANAPTNNGTPTE